MDCSLSGSSFHGILQARTPSGLPFPSPGDLPDPGNEPRSPALLADSLPTELCRKPIGGGHLTNLVAKIGDLSQDRV